MHAAQTAAQADGISHHQLPDGDVQSMHRKQLAPPPSGGGKKKGPPLRRGKWTQEEEAYANRLIQEFKAGLLPLTDGTTLRTFLSKLLNCDPMRISKKFVGSNCIGKQVFRRRTQDLNRLTPEQIQKSRAELSELERRFLDRVAQTNRVKSSGVGGGGGAAPPAATHPGLGLEGLKKHETDNGHPPSPPWLQTPLGYKQGGGAAMAAANLAGGEGNNRAAAAGRALLQGLNPSSFGSKPTSSGLTSSGSAGLLAMAELQRRASQQSMLHNLGGQSTQNLLAALGSSNGGASSLTNLAHTASGKYIWEYESLMQIVVFVSHSTNSARLLLSTASRLGLGRSNSINNLMLKTGFSRDQLSQLAKERGLSSASLSNMIERKNSFDALMSLDFQSLQSIDDLANLIQSGGSSSQAPANGMKNWSVDTSSSRNSLAGLAGASSSTGSLSQVARRLASTGKMESLLRSLSSNNVRNNAGNREGVSSSSNLQSLLQNMQGGGLGSTSMSSLLGGSGNVASAASLANLLRENSFTGLSALRTQDGLNNRNSSVEDFLSLVAAGDIPHQDPSLLNVPLASMQNNGGNNSGSNNLDAATMLAQQRLLAQATGNPALANAIASRSFSNLRNLSGSLRKSDSAGALLRAAAGDQGGSSLSVKRKLMELDGGLGSQRVNKR
jgi:hypothetical protein